MSERHSVASESGSSTDSHAETPDPKDGKLTASSGHRTAGQSVIIVIRNYIYRNSVLSPCMNSSRTENMLSHFVVVYYCSWLMYTF